MLEGHILLDEALCEFEKLYIKKALARHKQHLSKTAVVLGIHRNTLAKRVATYKRPGIATKRPSKEPSTNSPPSVPSLPIGLRLTTNLIPLYP